jgi:epoxide hydrolase 4
MPVLFLPLVLGTPHAVGAMVGNVDTERSDEDEIVRHAYIAGDGVELHVAVAGHGRPVILLHGFPENWRSWRHQFRALVDAGYSVWAPDMRGYNLSQRPVGRKAYRLQHLVADVAAVVRATGHGRAHIAGHDWGGIVAWTFAGHCPELVDKLIVLNAPHLGVYLKKIWRPPQMFRSWYVLLFLLPHVPEAVLSANDYRVVREMFRRTRARRGGVSENQAEEAIDRYVAALSAPGALTAALNYYRANMRRDGAAIARGARIAAETLVIWGDRDPALDMGLLDGLEVFVPRLRVQHLDTGHWVQSEAPDEVNQLIVEFLGSGSRRSSDRDIAAVR